MSDAHKTPKTVLITGFGPFRNIPVNPSWQVVKQFDGNTCGPFKIKTVELPVEYDKVDRFFSNMSAERNNIVFAIHCGVAASSPGIRLEQFARNAPYNAQDFAQKLAASNLCVEDGPDQIETLVDVATVARRTQDIFKKSKTCRNIKVDVSTDAGLYLCEYTYYQSMCRLKVPAVFIHVPSLSDAIPLENLTSAVQSIITVIADDVCGVSADPSLLVESAELQKWVSSFKGLLVQHPDMATAVAAIHTLINYIEQTSADTLAELRSGLKAVITALICSMSSKITSVSSGCELFLRFITLKAEYIDDFAVCKQQLVAAGKIFLEKAKHGREKIAKIGLSFIRDGATVLTHAQSRVVFDLLMAAAKEGKRFNVYVTEARPNLSGVSMAERLSKNGIPVTVIPDAAVGYVIEKVDFAIVGSEAIVESGGVVNTVGTYQIAVLCKATNTPFYAVGESFKFVRLYPLSQSEMPPNRSTALPGLPEGLTSISPRMDYTPPAFISLIFTDIGVLTPSAVSDELIKLYC